MTGSNSHQGPAMKSFATTRCVLFLVSATWSATVFAQSADTILTNGKIVTVDDQFRTVQALAIQGGRIVATGGNDEVQKLKGPATRLIDVQGRTVIPGLIDNHAHYMRAAEYWHREVRLDGVTSRKLALEMIAAKAKASAPGEWVLVLGGWALEQFTDSQAAFTREELDRVAPDNPVALQLIYFRIYTNSAGLKALGVDEPTGVLNGAPAVRRTLSKLGEVAMERMIGNAKTLMADLNRMGVTSFIDMGGRGFRDRY